MRMSDEDISTRCYESLLKAYDFLGLLDNSDYRLPLRAKTLSIDLLARVATRLGKRLPGRFALASLPAPELLTIVWRNRFEAQTGGREKGQVNVRSHYRSGQPGDWVNHFSPEHKQLFKDLYPGLVPTLGYAQSDDW